MNAIAAPKRGFTLIELMVTLTIAGILSALAAPSFTEMLRRSRVTSIANELVTALTMTRNEAVKRGVNVVLLSDSGTNDAWEGGWTMFADANRDGDIDDNGADPPCETDALGMLTEDCVLRVFEPATSGYTVRSNGNQFRTHIAYSPDGRKITGGSVGVTFTICDNSADTNTRTIVVLNGYGRVYSEKRNGACP